MSVPPRPSAAQMDRLTGLLAPLARITLPRVIGIERIPDRPVLLVGNHTRWGLIDLPFMMGELWQDRGIVARGLGDHGHYAVPLWRDLLTACGMVRGTRDNVRALMGEGETVLVFPGGSGEVFKSRGQEYTLLWKERLGFARLAIEFGYPIVPFAAVGAEEMYEVLLDRTDVPAPVRDLLERTLRMPLPPVARGIGPTVLPRPERLYFWFGEPIGTGRFAGDQARAGELRDEVRTAVEGGIQVLQDERASDPKRRLLPRLRTPG